MISESEIALKEYEIVASRILEANKEIISIERFLIILSGTIFGFSIIQSQNMMTLGSEVILIYFFPFLISAVYSYRVRQIAIDLGHHFEYLLVLESKLSYQGWANYRLKIGRERNKYFWAIRRRHVYFLIVAMNLVISSILTFRYLDSMS